jgi:hypothetical protein
VLATKHDKLPLIGPAMYAQVRLTVDAVDLDTDVLGTFTGDIARTGSPWETAVAKARLGMAATGCSIGIASEGSIGPDPTVPFVVSAVELVVFVDDELGIVVADTERGFDIVAVGADVAPGDDVGDLLRRGEFPDHALSVRPSAGGGVPAFTGVRNRNDLERSIQVCAAVSSDGLARIETDLRAHCCPSRRPIIERAAGRLAARLAACCPECATPGWGVVGVELGVDCNWCGSEVALPRADVSGCVSCSATRIVARERTGADPRYCDWCNP